MFVCIRIVWFIWWIYTASLRKFSKFGFWKLFSKFGFCLKTIQNVLNLFLKISLNCFLTLSLYISLTLIWKCLWTVLWKYLKTCFKNCLKFVRKPSKRFQNASKHFEIMLEKIQTLRSEQFTSIYELLDQLTIVETS